MTRKKDLILFQFNPPICSYFTNLPISKHELILQFPFVIGYFLVNKQFFNSYKKEPLNLSLTNALPLLNKINIVALTLRLENNS